jgi:hypothetical protein
MVHCSKLASGELTIQVYVMRVDDKMGFGELSPVFQVVSGVSPPVCKTPGLSGSIRLATELETSTTARTHHHPGQGVPTKPGPLCRILPV